MTLAPVLRGCFVASLIGLFACGGGGQGASGGSGPPSGGASTGGSSTTGGTSGTGGGTAGTGGGRTGGVTTTGGAPQGGRSATGGATGGSGARGGAAGGMTGGAAGGSPTGGTSTGGTPATAGGPLPSPTINGYDGERATTTNFDSAWLFHQGDATGAQAETFEDGAWRALNVPHDWSIEQPFTQSSPAGGGGGYLNGGLGWYRKHFTLPASAPGARLYLQFDGIYMDSTVWVNGTQVGARPYGYSSFEVDITAAAHAGAANVVAIKVNNQQPSSRWYSGSGIYRHTWLKAVNPVHVAYCGAYVTTPTVSAASATVSVKTDVQNQGAAAQDAIVTTTILGPDGATLVTDKAATASVAAGKVQTFSQSLTLPNPKIWTVDAPTLYAVKIVVTVGADTVDTYTARFGVRTFAFDAASGFSLNGKGMKLNGVCLHHDLGSLGAAINDRALERELQIMKAMGVNAVRTSHNPPAPELLQLCDRLGMVVMDEAFDCWYTGKNRYDYGRFFNTWAQTDIQDMVTRDRNHPSIVIWSIGNEIPDVKDTATAQKLIGWVKAKDATRAITQNMMGISDETAAVQDLMGFSYNQGNYTPYHNKYQTWKLVASESSSAVRTRGVYHTPVNQNILTSSDQQCSSYDNSVVSWGNSAESSWSAINTRNYMAGEFIWTGFDYIGEPTPYGWPAKSSYFGAVDTAGFPKDIFYFYQSKWNQDGPLMVHIVPMDWTSWTAGQSVPVLVYTNGSSVELSLNGKTLGSKTMSGTTAHLQWDVPFETGTLKATATKGGATATDEVRTAGAAAKVVLKVDRAQLAADGTDLAFIEADVVDANGVLVPRASQNITFAVTGPGAIVGVDNGNPISTESYKGTARAAFNGKALAIVQGTTTAGTITVTASAGALTAGTATIATTR